MSRGDTIHAARPRRDPSQQAASFRSGVADAVQGALHVALGVPLEEQFQVVTEHGLSGLVIGPGCLGVARGSDAVIVKVSPNRGCDADLRADADACRRARAETAPILRVENI